MIRCLTLDTSNFLAEFLAREKSTTRSDGIAAWAELKTMDIPKDYASWSKARGKHRKLKP